MKIRIISSKDDIVTVDERDEFVHFAFRPSTKDILNLINIDLKLCLIEIPISYNVSLSKSTQEILNMKGIELIVGNVWGHRTDIDEYADIPLDKIYEMKGEDVSVKNISISTGIGEPLIEHVLTL